MDYLKASVICGRGENSPFNLIINEHSLRNSFAFLQLYGDDGAWYPLSDKCYEVHADKYNYRFCPFREARQLNNHGPSHNIGRHPVWQSRGGEQGYRLLMEKGDNIQCPEGKPRQSQVCMPVVFFVWNS